MPPHEQPAAGSAADLALAKVPLPEDGLYKTLCFHTQQAVEKGLKAVLVSRGVEFPKSHSLTRLIDLLPADLERVTFVIESARLTAYATTFRYPAEDDDPDVPTDKYEEAVRLATLVLAWVEHVLGSGEKQ
jgi:HEPN domain-containing protein